MKNNVIAILDACVLYPAPLRDLLISLAAKHFYQAKWTERIHEEWIRNLSDKRPDLSEKQLQRTRELMNKSVLECLVFGYESIIEKIDLPDLDDRHVVAAAIQANADIIVTMNLKDFPKTYLDNFGLEVMHPDDFIVELYLANKIGFFHSVFELRGRLQNPKIEALDYIEIIRKQNLLRVADLLYENRGII